MPYPLSRIPLEPRQLEFDLRAPKVIPIGVTFNGSAHATFEVSLQVIPAPKPPSDDPPSPLQLLERIVIRLLGQEFIDAIRDIIGMLCTPPAKHNHT